MLNKFKKILSNKFTTGILLISGGTAFAQFANILFSPIITRLYSPGEYGVLTVFSAILGILSISGALKYEWGIAISEDEPTAINVVILACCVSLVISLLFLFVVLFMGAGFLDLFNGGILVKYKYFIPLGVFLSSIYIIFSQWALREKNYRGISRTKFVQSISQNALMIGLGVGGFGAIGLIIGRIIGQSAGIISLSKSFFSKHRVIRKVDISGLLWCAKRFKRFPLYSAPSQLLNTAGLQLPVIFLTSMYGPKVVGFYGLANAVVNLPMILIGQSVSDVFYAEAASMGRKEPLKLKKLSQKLLKRLSLLGAMPVLVLAFAGPKLFTIVYGEQWNDAGGYAQIIAFLVYARFVFSPVSRLYSVFERQKEDLLVDIIRILLILLAFWLSSVLQTSPLGAVVAYSVAMILVYFIAYLGSVLILNQEIKKLENMTNASYCVDSQN